MKIAIVGYSGAGKSTLAQKLGKRYGAEVLHLDNAHFLPGWQERDRNSEREIVSRFLAEHDAWVIDGTYSKVCYEERMENADCIVMLLFNRFSCFVRALGRFYRYRNTTRPDMAEGCPEKFDLEFALWILGKGRTKARRQKFQQLKEQYKDKVVVLRNQRQLDAFERTL